MYDCVYPTRTARFGSAIVSEVGQPPLKINPFKFGQFEWFCFLFRAGPVSIKHLHSFLPYQFLSCAVSVVLLCNAKSSALRWFFGYRAFWDWHTQLWPRIIDLLIHPAPVWYGFIHSATLSGLVWEWRVLFFDTLSRCPSILIQTILKDLGRKASSSSLGATSCLLYIYT